MRKSIEIVLWNILMYLISVFLLILGIQHAVFFYSWPPDGSRWLDVPTQTYLILGLAIFILLKISNYVWDRGEIYPDRDGEDDDI